MALIGHAARAAGVFRRILAGRGKDATYQRLGDPVLDVATGVFAPTVLETKPIRAVRGDLDTVENVLGARITSEDVTTPWEFETATSGGSTAVVGPVSPQDLLIVDGTTYEVLAAGQDTLEVRWIVATRERK